MDAKIWSDDPAGLYTNVPVLRKGIVIGSPEVPLKTIYVEDIISTGTPLSVYAAGTAYALTATSAALDFGTTDPVLTITTAGTYRISATANLLYNGATFAANRTVTLKLRRTNNTPADIANSTVTLTTGIVTTTTGTFANVQFPDVIYTTVNITDTLTIYGDVSVVPTAGSLDVVQASIIAVRVA